MSDRAHAAAFFIGGAVYMTLIGGVKYAQGESFGLLATIGSFLFGALLGSLAVTPSKRLTKEVIFIGGGLYLLWTILNPVQNLGDNLLVNSAAFWSFIAITIIVLERELLNTLLRSLGRKEHYTPGFIGSIMLLVILHVTGAWTAMGEWMSDNQLLTSLLLLGWFGILYFIISRGLTKTAQSLARRLGG